MKKFKSAIQFLSYWVSFTCLAIVVRGYEYGTGDQVLQIPLLKKIINPELYMSDMLFPWLYTNKTILYSLIIGLNRIIPHLEATFFLIYFLTQLLLFIGIYLLGNELMSNKLKSLLSCLLFIYPLPIGGSATTTVDKLLLPRTITMMMSVYCLYFIFKKKVAITLITLGIIFLIHPLTGVILLVLILPVLFSIWGLRSKKKNMLFIGLICLLAGGVLLIPLKNNLNHLSTYFSSSNDWLEVLHVRNAYAFPLLWNYRGWLNLVVLVLPITYALYMTNNIKNYLRSYIAYILLA